MSIIFQLICSDLSQCVLLKIVMPLVFGVGGVWGGWWVVIPTYLWEVVAVDISLVPITQFLCTVLNKYK